MREVRNLFVEHPKRPEPIELAVQEVIHWVDLDARGRWGVLGNAEKLKYIKRSMVQKLATELIERLEPFIVQDMCQKGEVYRVQVTLSDRGAYENWLPAERESGRRQGYKQGDEALRNRLPYGIDPDRVYE